ncbi:MAG: thiamine S protein [Marmoricola sp.]|jgi:molybdopterin synthase sulfur carrier subunit|nr:thiamine S protein [Marmoricola sp.]
MDSTAARTAPSGGLVTLRYWAAARSAAGVDEDRIEVDGPVSLAWLVRSADGLHRDSARFRDVIGTCSTLLGDRPVTSDDPETVQVPPGSTVEFLPPFAGG